jgi:hypothetical protein
LYFFLLHPSPSERDKPLTTQGMQGKTPNLTWFGGGEEKGPKISLTPKEYFYNMSANKFRASVFWVGRVYPHHQWSVNQKKLRISKREA